jgi:hypothetical protein
MGIPKGSAAATTDVMGGQPLVVDSVTAARPHIAAGKLKVIAATRRRRRTCFGVKPVAEQGLPGFEVVAWNALYAPKGTPKEIVAALNAEINKTRPAGNAAEVEGPRFDRGGSAEAEFGRAERSAGPADQDGGHESRMTHSATERWRSNRKPDAHPERLPGPAANLRCCAP